MNQLRLFFKVAMFFFLATTLGAQTPQLAEIKFLVSGNEVTQTPNGDVTVELVFDKQMNQAVDPVVKFGLEAPFDLSVPKGQGWISGTLWQGFFTVSNNNPQTGDGEYIFKIFGAEDQSNTEMDTTLSNNETLNSTLLICRSGELALSTGTLNFGTITLGQPKNLSFTINNESCADLNIDNVIVPPPFALINMIPNFTIPGNGSQVLNIRFNPTVRQESNKTITIISDDRFQSTHEVQVTGTAIGPRIALRPTSNLEFGNVEVGFDKTLPVEVINVPAFDPAHSATLNVSSIFTNNSVYSVDKEQLTIAPGDTETVQVTFAPNENQSYIGRILTFQNDDLIQPMRTLVLSGTANDITPPPPVPNLVVSGLNGLFTRSDFLSICWDDPNDASGIAEIWWKFVTTASPPTSATDTTAAGGRLILSGGNCADLRLFGRLTSGFWYCYVWFVDGSGNSGYASAVEATFIYDVTPPPAPIVIDRRISAQQWFGFNNLFDLTISIPEDPDRGVRDAAEVRWKYQTPPETATDYDGRFFFESSGNSSETFDVPFSDSDKSLCGDDSLYIWLVDEAGNVSAENRTSARYRFDICGPEIVRADSLDEVNSVADLGLVFRDTVEITDDLSLREVNGAQVYYRFGGAESSEPVRQATRIGESNSYVIDIPTAGVTRRGVEYQVVAVDSLGNESTGPVNDCSCEEDDDNEECEEIWFPIRTRVETDFRIDKEGLPVPLSAGEDSSNYQLFSIPYHLDTSSVLNVLEDDLGTYDITQWRFFDYNNANPNTAGFVEGGTARDFTPGRSYFIISRQEEIVVDSGPGVTQKTVCPDTLRLYEGWNLIATPFNFPVDRESLSLLNSETNISLRSYERGWNITDVMEPWKGYALFVMGNSDSNDDDPIYLIVQPKAAPGRIQKPNATPIALGQREWLVQISATAGLARDLENWAGVQAQADEGYDALELAEPPTIGKYVKVAFPRPEWQLAAAEFSTDIRPAVQSEQVWEFTVESNYGDTKIDLSFDFLGDFPDNAEVFLIDEELKQSQNLRSNRTYSFRSGKQGSDKTLTLIVGSADFAVQQAGDIGLVPDRFELLQNFPNPFNPETSIRFNLSQAADVTLTIYDLLGNKIKTLIDDERRNAGYFTERWNGRDDSGQKVSSGVYVYRMTTEGQSFTRKMILLK